MQRTRLFIKGFSSLAALLVVVATSLCIVEATQLLPFSDCCAAGEQFPPEPEPEKLCCQLAEARFIQSNEDFSTLEQPDPLVPAILDWNSPQSILALAFEIPPRGSTGSHEPSRAKSGSGILLRHQRNPRAPSTLL